MVCLQVGVFACCCVFACSGVSVHMCCVIVTCFREICLHVLECCVCVQQCMYYMWYGYMHYVCILQSTVVDFVHLQSIFHVRMCLHVVYVFVM